MKFNYYFDDITKCKIYVIAGHEWNTLDRYTIRIFGEKQPEYKGATRRVLRYFPQIDDNEKENIYQLGPEEGFRRLSEAKEELEKAISEMGIKINE